ncbi:MAG: FkbM family methyltransferase [Phycisphaeraceae bacterium]
MTKQELLDRWQASRRPLNAERIPRWVRWRIDRKHAKWFGRKVEREVRLFWGQPMTILHPEHVSGKIAKRGYFEQGLTRILIERLKPGEVFYDIGAHYGYFSLLAATITGSEGHVYSFEPTPETFARLTKNLATIDHATPVNLAVYSETMELVFCEMGSRDSSLNHVRAGGPSDEHSDEIRVPAVSMDDFVKDNRPPDLIKVDAEGAEFAILQGMTGLLETGKPRITLEVGDYITQQTGNPPSREGVDFLLERGYDVFECIDGEIKPHTPIDEYGYDNLLFVHPADGRSSAG